MERFAALPLALVAWFACGCLTPQDIVEDVPEEPPRNYAPRIIADQVLVEGMPVHWLHVQTSCDRIRFRIGAVEDLDLGDDLELRFFVDYDRGCDVCTRWEDRYSLRATADTGAIRAIDFEYELRLPLDVGVHLIEALVSDGFASDENVAPANRWVLDGRGIDTTYWVIEVHEAEDLACLPAPA